MERDEHEQEHEACETTKSSWLSADTTRAMFGRINIVEATCPRMIARRSAALRRTHVANHVVKAIEEKSRNGVMDWKEEGEELYNSEQKKHKWKNKQGRRKKEVAPHCWGQQIGKTMESTLGEPELPPPWRRLASFVVLFVVTGRLSDRGECALKL